MTRLVSGLRRHVDFVGRTDVKRQFLVEIRPGSRITGWSQNSGDCYRSPLQFVWDGIPRDVVNVRTTQYASLTRVESIADCIATAGTYFFDPDETVSPVRWDDGVTKWDNGVTKWDAYSFLYVHLPSGLHPRLTVVIAELSFHYSNFIVTHPDLGEDWMQNGGFEDWDDATTPTDWDRSLGAGGGDVQKVAALSRGDWACKLIAGSSGATEVWGYQQGNCAPGEVYSISGYYQTPLGISIAPQICVRDAAGSEFLRVDGSNLESSTQSHDLTLTHGNTRRFVWHIRAWQAEVQLRFIAPIGCAVTFDDVKWKRIWRRNLYEPRISSASIPSTSMGNNDVLPGLKQVGNGQITLVAQGLDSLMGKLDWVGAPAFVDSGGVFHDGIELDREEYARGFTATVQRISHSDNETRFTIKDARDHFHLKLPLRRFQKGLNALDERFEGEFRRMWFGVKTGIIPVRWDKSATTGLGTYEVADTTELSLKAIDAVKAYLDDKSAKDRDTTKCVTLVEDTDYTVDLDAGQITMLEDSNVIEITQDNNKLDFNDGSVKAATIPVGVYTPRTLAAASQTVMNTVSSDWSAVYSNLTHKVTIGRSAGTCTLLCQTGDNRERSVWTEIGFSKESNRTGAASYEGDDVLFDVSTLDDLDRLIIRVDGQGYADDDDGTYTGTPNALIQLGSDLIKSTLLAWMGKSSAILHQDYDDARTDCPQGLGLYLSDEMSTSELFDLVEKSVMADIIIDGEGKVSFLPYAADIPANPTQLFDEDFISFSVEQANSDSFTEIRVFYDEDPSTNRWLIRSAVGEATGPRFDRDEVKDVKTLLLDQDDAQRIANAMRSISQTPLYRYNFAVKGILLDVRVGDVTLLTRARALASSGSLNGEPVRLIGVRQNYQTGVSECTAVSYVEL